MSRLTRDGTADTVSRDQILRHERGQGNINFPCSADHEQDRQPYPVDLYSCYMCDHTYIVKKCFLLIEGSIRLSYNNDLVPVAPVAQLVSTEPPGRPVMHWGMLKFLQ